MTEPQDLAGVLEALDQRIRRLETLYGVVDLLGLPGLLAGGAASIFDLTQTASTLGDQTPGFFPRESSSGGVAIRWTRFPEPAQLAVPALEGYPFRLELTALRMPHIQEGDDVALSLSDIGEVPLGALMADEGVSVFTGEFTSARSGLLTASLTSRTCLTTGGADSRRLGLPFVSLRTFPLLSAGEGAGR
jgi:hypothetical protein